MLRLILRKLNVGRLRGLFDERPATQLSPGRFRFFISDFAGFNALTERWSKKSSTDPDCSLLSTPAILGKFFWFEIK